MRYDPIDPQLFVQNRRRLAALMSPRSLAVVHSNDILPTNADGTLPLKQSSDLFYLSGVDQEESILLLFPDADDPTQREILFLREPTPQVQLWEGRKLTREDARKATGIRNIQWLSAFPSLLHRLMCEAEGVYLNSNEHRRAVVEVQSRDARFIDECRRRHPLHQYLRLARLMHALRIEKSAAEMALLQRACDVTRAAVLRVLKFTRPGVMEFEVEAEFAHEFIRNRAGFAYNPIIATGANACALHYNDNSAPCRKGELLLLDVGACYANYNADMTRTIPVSGRFTPRQKKVYRAVLRVLRTAIDDLRPGRKIKEWQKNAEQHMEKELLDLGLITASDIRKQSPEQPAFKRYFMHGLGHPLGLDVHDVGFTTEPVQPGWVMTVEPAIYIPDEGFGIRLEDDILVGRDGNTNLMAMIPIEPEEIESLMKH